MARTMPNLFINTRFDFAEEDRLTNALMAVLEHADRLVLRGFLRLIAPDLHLEDGADVTFALQLVFDGSRPDARIGTDDWAVVIETKRSSDLDDDQFTCHWRHLEKTSKRTLLVGLTDGYAIPPIVDVLNARTANPKLSCHHLSWSDVLRQVCELQDDFVPDSASWLLLNQLEGYLRSEGYYYLKGSIEDDMMDYGRLLMDLSHHEQHTEKQLVGHLERLRQAVMGHPDIMGLRFRTRTFSGRDRAHADRVNFRFLTAPVPGLPQANYRILPHMTRKEGLGLSYYLTYSRDRGPWAGITDWLMAHQGEMTAECGGFYRFGLLSRTVFHLNMRCVGEAARPFFTGDTEQIARLGEQIAGYFIAIDGWLSRALAEVE